MFYPDPMFGTMLIVILSAAYIFQHTLLNRRKPTKNPTVCNRLIQKFLDITIHNVMPCSTCKDQFIQQGVFEFHNRVSARLLKSHTCSAPYSGYDYLVAYLIWTMDRAMLEIRGEGFLAIDPTSSRENRPIPVPVDPPPTALPARLMNTNNSNASMDYQPVPSSDESATEYETPSDSSEESITSMDYLVLSQESSDSEGYESALHQNSPTTSMNVNNDDDATITTEHEDFATFSLYTARSSVTADTYDDMEEDEDDGSECVNASTTVSSNLTARTDQSCTGSEPTLHSSEDTTKSQCGSDFTKSVMNLTKSEPSSGRSRLNKRTAKPENSVAMGDNTLVKQMIAQSVKEHLVISPAASANEMHGFEQMAESSCNEADIHVQSPYDTMNRNNNGNTFARSRPKYRSALDEEANIDGYGEFSADDTFSDDDDDDYSDAALTAAQVPCTMTEENDVQLTYSTDSLDDNLDDSATLDRLSKRRGLSPDVEQQFGNNYFRESPVQQPRRFDCGDLEENRNANFRAQSSRLPTFGTIMYPDTLKRGSESRTTTHPCRGRFPDTPRSKNHSDGRKHFTETVYVFPEPQNTTPSGTHVHKTIPDHYAPRQY